MSDMCASATANSSVKYVQTSLLEENTASPCNGKRNEPSPIMQTSMRESDYCSEGLASHDTDLRWRNCVRQRSTSLDKPCVQEDRPQQQQSEGIPRDLARGTGVCREQCSEEHTLTKSGRVQPRFPRRLLSGRSKTVIVPQVHGNRVDALGGEREQQADRPSNKLREDQISARFCCTNQMKKTAEQNSIPSGAITAGVNPPVSPAPTGRRTDVCNGPPAECIIPLEEVRPLGDLPMQNGSNPSIPGALIINRCKKISAPESGLSRTVELKELFSAYEMQCEAARASVDRICRDLVATSYIPRLECTGYSKMGNESTEDSEHKLAIHNMFIDAVERLQTGVVPTSNRCNLPKECVTYLKQWFDDHFDHPYPTDLEKLALSCKTQLSVNQVSHWFINYRKRVWKPSLPQDHPAASQNSTKKRRL